MSDLVKDFASLFAGRTDCYGTNEGGCKRGVVDVSRYHHHLSGTEAIGIYPLVDTEQVVGPGAPVLVPKMVKWGCVDIDEKNPIRALNLVKVLDHLEMHPWLETTRSNHWHVWVFGASWMPAKWMRNALLFACEIAEVPPREVNPKSEDGGKSGIGNYVRLPYAGHLTIGNFQTPQTMVTPRSVEDFPTSPSQRAYYPLDSFLRKAMKRLVKPALVQDIGSLFKEPPPKRSVDLVPTPFDDAFLDRMSGLTYTIWKDGPTERFGYDRSRTLCRLAYLCEKDGFDFSETYSIVENADSRWGKYEGDPDKLEDIVGRAFRGVG